MSRRLWGAFDPTVGASRPLAKNHHINPSSEPDWVPAGDPERGVLRPAYSRVSHEAKRSIESVGVEGVGPEQNVLYYVTLYMYMLLHVCQCHVPEASQIL